MVIENKSGSEMILFSEWNEIGSRVVADQSCLVVGVSKGFVVEHSGIGAREAFGEMRIEGERSPKGTKWPVSATYDGLFSLEIPGRGTAVAGVVTWIQRR